MINNCIWNAHHALGWSFQGASKPIEHYCKWHNIGVINHLIYKIDNSKHNNFIISSENLFQLINIEFIERFFNRLSAFDIKVIVYLRDQVSFIESWYSELVRADYYKLNEDIDDFIKNPRYNLDYYSVLRQWERFVEPKNIFVLNFNDESKNGNLIDSFCRTINLKNYEKFIIPSRINERISSKQLKLLKVLNNQKLSHQEWMKERGKILKLDKETICECNSLLTKKHKTEILTTWKSSNEKLFKFYGVNLGSVQ